MLSALSKKILSVFCVFFVLFSFSFGDINQSFQEELNIFELYLSKAEPLIEQKNISKLDELITLIQFKQEDMSQYLTVPSINQEIKSTYTTLMVQWDKLLVDTETLRKAIVNEEKPKLREPINGIFTVDYNLNQGNLYSLALNSNYYLFNSLKIANNSFIQYSDGSLGSYTLQINNQALIDGAKYNVNLMTFNDKQSAANNLVKIESAMARLVDVFGTKDVDFTAKVDLQFSQTDTNRYQRMFFNLSKMLNQTRFQGSYMLNSSVSSNTYHQINLGLDSPKNGKLLNFEYYYLSSFQYLFYPENSANDYSYFSINNYLKNNELNINNRININLYPNQAANSYYSFINSVELKSLRTFVNYDLRVYPNSNNDYYRLGLDSTFSGNQDPFRNTVGLDYFNYVTNTNSYINPFWRIHFYNYSSNSLLSQISVKLNRRFYPSNSISAWSVDISDSGRLFLLKDWESSRYDMLTYTCFDNASSTQSNTLFLAVNLQNKYLLAEDLNINVDFRTNMYYYLLNRSADSFTLAITSYINFIF